MDSSTNPCVCLYTVVFTLKDKKPSEIQKELVKYLSQKKNANAEVNKPYAINK